MPAIRYPNNAVFPVVTTSPGGCVSVRHNDGEWRHISWMGFICRHGTGGISGKYCKIKATDVTKDDGFVGSYWITLKKTEFVLGWVVESMKWGQNKFEFGAYAVIDDNCTPIVIDSVKVTPEKGIELAPVVQINLARRKA